MAAALHGRPERQLAVLFASGAPSRSASIRSQCRPLLGTAARRLRRGFAMRGLPHPLLAVGAAPRRGCRHRGAVKLPHGWQQSTAAPATSNGHIRPSSPEDKSRPGNPKNKQQQKQRGQTGASSVARR